MLCRYGARCDGTFPGNIPAPIQLAEFIGNKSVCDALNQTKVKTDAREKLAMSLLEEAANPINKDIAETDSQQLASESSITITEQCAREKVITVGDVKTTMTIRGVRNRSPDEFGAFTETPGDFHTQGYIMQCIARIIGPGGFYYVMRQVLKRIKVTPNSFDGIFKEGNFQRNFNAISDFYWGIMIACVKQFQSSEKFPNTFEQEGDGNLVSQQLKEWAEE